MGGETLLTDRFEQLVDFMIAHERFDLCFSFVTNGTVFKPDLIEKLKRFQRVGIEVSLETMDAHNAYQRQGTDTQQVLDNIKKYLKLCDRTSVTLTLRPAVSVLTIGYYIGVLQYALDHGMIVKSNLCYNPKFLAPQILPNDIKQQYIKTYQDFLSRIADVETKNDYNASDPNNYAMSIKQQAEMCVSLLRSPAPADSEVQLAAMVRHCERWDRVYGLDARTLYPEFQEILQRHDYSISG